jgi:DNA-binding IclR family transcriptional regulator
MKTVEKEQRHIQSIEVGFRLIGVLEAARAKLPLKTIAERAGMPASKAHLYMVSFVRLGLVAQDPATMRYGLGPYAVQLGLAGLRQLDVVDLARGPMEELQQSVGLSVHLSIWGNMGPTIVATSDGELDVPMIIKVGHVLPLLTSATGRVFLALLPAALLTPILHRVPTASAATRAAIEDAKREMARNGVTTSDSRVHEGFAAISAPIFDHSGALAASMTLIGQRSHVVPLMGHGPVVEKLKAVCDLVTRAMGREAAAPDASLEGPSPRRAPARSMRA